MKKKLYNDPIIKRVVNAYIQAVNNFDTGEVWLQDKEIKGFKLGYAEWRDKCITISWEKSGQAFYNPITYFDDEISNEIINMLLQAMNDDINTKVKANNKQI